MDGSREGQDFVLVDHKDTDDYNAAGILPQSAEIIAQIQEWLEPTDYLAESSEYKRHLGSHVAGTGSWIAQTDAYQTWHDSPECGSLWIKAIAGAGKSVVAASTASSLATTEQVPVLSFFFRQIIATNHHPHFLVRDWISQLLPYCPPLQARMKAYVADRKTVDSISISGLWNELLDALSSFPKVYCIVDALDEMDIDQTDFLWSLIRLGKQNPSSIKVLMTSRPLPRIEAILRDRSCLQLRLDQGQVDEDIVVYMNHRLRLEANMDEPLKNAVRQSIGQNSQGSFLYARLMMDGVLESVKREATDIAQLQHSLARLPTSLEDMYNGMLLDHSRRSGVSQELQLTILQWITHCSRPLRLLELSAILDYLGESGNETGGNAKGTVRAACGPLLEILEDETISVIHHSFTEFLVDTNRTATVRSDVSVHPQFPVISAQETHRFLAASCLKYLKSGCLSDLKLVDPDKTGLVDSNRAPINMAKMQHAFLDYAANHWYAHVRELPVLDDWLRAEIDNLLDKNNPVLSSWLGIAWKKECSYSKVTSLHVAAWAGMTNYAIYAIGQGYDCNVLDDSERTPLSWASEKGHIGVAALLLENGAPANSDDFHGLTPFHYAAQADRSGIVKLIVESGVSPMTGKTKDPGRRCGNSRSSIGDSPLLYACRSGCIKSVREMIPYLSSEDIYSALRWAAESGASEVVDLLLSSLDVYLEPSDYKGTPLFLATSRWHSKIVRSLLKKGADPNKRSANPDRSGVIICMTAEGLSRKQLDPTPFHALAGIRKSHHPRKKDDEDLETCFRLLLDAGGDMNAVDGEGRTPLHYSVGGDFPSKPVPALVELLLRNGADPNVADRDGETPLHKVRLGSESASCIHSLLAHGADPGAKRHKDGRTPTHTGVDTIHSLETSLFAYFPDWNMGDSKGNTPLHIVIAESYHPEESVESLLKAGADPNRKNQAGETPLHLLRESGRNCKPVIQLLVSAGADLDARDNGGRTLLATALNHRRNTGFSTPASSVPYLIEAGASLNARDHAGNNALHHVCRTSPNDEAFQFLLRAGADPFQINNIGDTLLHELARHYVHLGHPACPPDILNTLLHKGISPLAQNNIGQTLFHIICTADPAYHYRPTELGQHPISVFLDLKEADTGLDTADHHGIRPVHLAAMVSEHLVGLLIGKGVDVITHTYEGRNLLHIAAKARQSNTIGLLIEHYNSLGRADLINSTDQAGRTPLHDACRSGRPESVALLLKAGAELNPKDDWGLTPLHVCAEILEERMLWTMSENAAGRNRINAREILISDPTRPTSLSCSWNSEDSHRNGVTRCRDIIRLLIAHGARIRASSRLGTPIDLARENGYDEMVSELLPLYLEEVYGQKPGNSSSEFYPSRTDKRLFGEEYFSLRTQNIGPVLERVVRSGDDNMELCEQLLSSGEHDAIKQLTRLGVNFMPGPEGDSRGKFLTKLAEEGCTSLFEFIGSTMQDASWIEGSGNSNPGTTRPYILAASKRELPNLEIIKVMVEKFGAKLNLKSQSPLHVLASVGRWWQVEAVEYLLQRGADPNLRDQHGKSALDIAVDDGHSIGSHTKRKIVKLLLEHGADPNHTDSAGMTCLYRAIYDLDLVMLLVSHGARLNHGAKPPLFSAVETQSIAAVRTLLKAGADCNVWRKIPPQTDRDVCPILRAALPKRDTAESRGAAVEIVKLLLNHGADPYLEFNGDTTVVHHVFGSGGVLEPFLDLQDLELERRDRKGRTLLLAACKHPRVLRIPGEPGEVKADGDAETVGPTVIQLLHRKGASLSVVDGDGNNPLHTFFSVRRDWSRHSAVLKETFSFLIKEVDPAFVRQSNGQGYQPLHYAVKMAGAKSCQALLDAGADPLVPDPNGDTVLHYLAATMRQGKPLFKKFIDLGVDINSKNNRGETPLFHYFAASVNDFQFNTRRDHFTPFTEAGADLFATNNDGETLLHVTAKRVYDNFVVSRWNEQDVVDAFQFLMDLGLDPMTEDKNQRTAMDVAAAYGNDPILDLFRKNKRAGRQED